MQKDLLAALGRVRALAGASKLGRLAAHPTRYLGAILFRKLVYPLRRAERRARASLFFGETMTVALPAATDIYLTGGKSHESEIRLAAFMIRRLQPGDHVLDIGAHYGYFTLLAARLVGAQGRVQAYEPSSAAFGLLQENVRNRPQVAAFQKVIFNAETPVTFFEFSNLYSEYNSYDVAQFSGASWFRKHPPRQVTIPAATLDGLTAGDFRPSFIKIDVEGAEPQVLEGGLGFLRRYSPVLAMEYLEPSRQNGPHRQALQLLLELGYRAHLLDADGVPVPLADAGAIENYLAEHRLESDNVVLMKSAAR